MTNTLAPQAMPTTDAYTTEAVHGAMTEDVMIMMLKYTSAESGRVRYNVTVLKSKGLVREAMNAAQYTRYDLARRAFDRARDAHDAEHFWTIGE